MPKKFLTKLCEHMAVIINTVLYGKKICESN